MDTQLEEYLRRRAGLQMDEEALEGADPGDMDRSLSPEPLALRERPRFGDMLGSDTLQNLRSLAQWETRGEDNAADALGEAGGQQLLAMKPSALTAPPEARGVTVAAGGRMPLPAGRGMPADEGSGGGYLDALRRAQRMDDLSAAVGRNNAAMQQLAGVTSRGVFQPQALPPMPSEVSKEAQRRQAVLDYLKQQREDESSAADIRLKTAHAKFYETPKPTPPTKPLPTPEELAESRDLEKRLKESQIAANNRRGLPKPGKPADTGPKLNKAAETLRKEFNGLPVVKDYNDVAAAYGKMKKAAEAPSAAGDLSLIFGYMKMLDPGSTVREGEFANAQNAGGIDDKLASTYNRVLNGQRLTEDQRRDFIGRARQLFDTHADQLNAAAERYTGIAKKSGADPEDVVIRPPSEGMAPDRKARLQELRAKKAAGTLGGP